MERSRLASFYLWTVAVVGLLLWAVTLVDERPWLHPNLDLIESTLILLGLTLLSGFSPIETRVGGVLNVTLAPLCGAVALGLPAWAVMTVAVFGTIDRRRPGRDVAWSAFAFNRGMWIVACGLPSLLMMSVWTRSLVNEIAALSGALALLLLVNTTMMAVAVRLLRRIGILRALRSALAGNVLTFLAMPLLGILIAHLMDAPPIDRLVVFLLYGPVLIYRTSLQKQRRLDTWLPDSF